MAPPRKVSHDWVLRRRLAVQRLTGAPLPRAVDAVRLLVAVQAQDAPLAHFSLGLRSRNPTYAVGLAEQATGTFTRTHVLRPTWHFIAVEDLRWLQRLTAPKIASSLTARRKGLDLEPARLTRWLDRVVTVLAAAEAPVTRKRVQAALTAAGTPVANEQLAHILLAAELDGLICGGAPAGVEHTYVLVDDAIPQGDIDDLPRDDAIRLLTHRFMAGHGPADEHDLARWCTLTLGEIRGALASLEEDDSLEAVDLDGRTLWHDPGISTRTTRRPAALLLPTFDEATLTYSRTGFPRSSEVLDRTRLIAEAGGGVAIVDGIDVGLWKRSVRGSRVEVTVRPEQPLTSDQHDAIAQAASALAAFLDRKLALTVTD